MKVSGVVDAPLGNSPHYRQRIRVAGWVYGHERHDQIARVVVHGPGGEIGSTRLLYSRHDVATALGIDSRIRTGFQLLAAIQEKECRGKQLPIDVQVEFRDGTLVLLARVEVMILANDFTDADYGDLCNPVRTGLLHRKHLFTSGHPAEHPSLDCVDLLTTYIPAGARVFDVGCGIGAYHEALSQRGISWTGCETSGQCLRELARRRLPHRAVKGRFWNWGRYRLPASDHEFDVSIAVEVLEHVRRPEAFLAEIARVTRRYAFFSVPNVENLPFLADRLVAPWHMLEGDHVNFFTRFNLGPLLRKFFRHVEIIDYGRQPLASPDGLPLPYHLFAICEI